MGYFVIGLFAERQSAVSTAPDDVARAWMNMTSATELSTKKPHVSGSKVSLYNWPMAVPIIMDIMEDVAPMIAEAMPAT